MSTNPELDALEAMLDELLEGEAVSFALEGDDQGMLARARRECTALLHDVMQRVSHPLTVETGVERFRIRTHMGWTGDVTTVVALGTPAATLAAHLAALQATAATSLHRLRLLTMIVTATGKVAATIATPGAALLALPIAYRCVREIYERAHARGASAGVAMPREG